MGFWLILTKFTQFRCAFPAITNRQISSAARGGHGQSRSSAPALGRPRDCQAADYLQVCWWETALPRRRGAKPREAAGEARTEVKPPGTGRNRRGAERGSPHHLVPSSPPHLESGAVFYVNISKKRRRRAAFAAAPAAVAGAQRRVRAERAAPAAAAALSSAGPGSVSARCCRTRGPAADNAVIVLLWGPGLLCADYPFITPGSPAEL